MSKSIKLKDNNYLDSSSITHNRTPLNTVLEDMSNREVLIPYSGMFISDGQTTSINLTPNKLYLFINAHPYIMSAYLINSYNGRVVELTNGLNDVTFNFENYVLTVTAKNQMRGYIFRFKGVNSP